MRIWPACSCATRPSPSAPGCDGACRSALFRASHRRRARRARAPAEPKFGNDRHRDFELLTAGYLVLRLTNEQVAADLPLAIEKIRAVVQLRRQRG